MDSMQTLRYPSNYFRTLHQFFTQAKPLLPSTSLPKPPSLQHLPNKKRDHPIRLILATTSLSFPTSQCIEISSFNPFNHSNHQPQLHFSLVKMISPTESCPIHAPKAAQARCMLRSHPEKWVGKAPLDARDRALLDAEPVSFVDYSQGSFLRKIVSSIVNFYWSVTVADGGGLVPYEA